MAEVTRLVTLVDLDAGADPHTISVSARHEAVLTDGGHVVLLNDRGWGTSSLPGIWSMVSVKDIEDTARDVVGPDEPFGDRSQQDMEADHWASLAAILRSKGIELDPEELGRVPHDVVLSEQLLARLGPRPSSGDRL